MRLFPKHDWLMKYEYTEEELHRLHETLYEILGEIIRVCEKCHIQYFIIGGTAIGAHFWQSILPWDDDVDIGMTRKDYERFLSMAPRELGSDYFLQWFGSDPHVPFFFAKVRKNHTLFSEHQFKDIQMHQGIFVDVFAFDHIPRHRWMERLQYETMGFFNACFIGKEIWQWKYCGHCQTDVPRRRGFIPCLITRIINTFCSKKTIYRLLVAVQTAFNKRSADYCKNIVTTNDWVRMADITHPRQVTLGPLQVSAPAHLEDYLHNHYPVLHKHIPREQQVNHRPDQLVFDTRVSGADGK